MLSWSSTGIRPSPCRAIDGRGDQGDHRPRRHGRYFGSLFGPDGWTDLAIAASGINPDATTPPLHFGPRPITYRGATSQNTRIPRPGRGQSVEDVRTGGHEQSASSGGETGGDDAMVIPLWRAAQASVMSPGCIRIFPRSAVSPGIRIRTGWRRQTGVKPKRKSAPEGAF